MRKIEMEKGTRKVVLLCAVLMGILLGNSQIVKAEIRADEKLVIEDAIDFIDDEGNVIATFTPYSEDDPAPAEFGKAVSHNVDVELGAGRSGYLENIYSLKHGDRIDFNITISPQASSQIGLYNRNTGLFGFPTGSLSSTGWNGYLTVNGDGRYSLAFDNLSNVRARYKGTYTL